MALDYDRRPEPQLSDDFGDRLELALVHADRERRRRHLIELAQPWLAACLLAGPIVGWRLILATPDGLHIAINALAWVTFLLDVGVHLDAALLRSTGLGALPAVILVLIFALVAATLVLPEEKPR